MRVVVTGAGGQLGHDVVACCSAAGDAVFGFDRAALDVTSRDAVRGAITSVQPDVVINCAAWTAVDACESDADRALLVNALSVRWVREACELVGAQLVHVSTDYVFDGTLDRPYHEWDVPNPQSVYGRSKLAGELEVGASAAVVRTSWVCGEHGHNMVSTVLRMLADGHETLRFVDDQRGCPTFTADLAPLLRRLAIDRRTGVHHVTNQGAVSWFELVREIVRSTGRDPAMVEPISTAELDPPRPAPRPANSVLDNTVLRAAGIPLLRDFREPLRELVGRLTTS